MALRQIRRRASTAQDEQSQDGSGTAAPDASATSACRPTAAPAQPRLPPRHHHRRRSNGEPRPHAAPRRPTPSSSTAAARVRQRDEFGGINWGAAFFGWIVALGIGVLLTAIVAPPAPPSGSPTPSGTGALAGRDTIGIVGGALLIVIALLAYYAGGYVAGRMSRFDGARQGFAVWVFGLLVTAARGRRRARSSATSTTCSSKLNLPRIPVDASDLTTGGAISLAAIVLGSLLAAMIGGKVGQRYHRRVDRAALDTDYAGAA